MIIIGSPMKSSFYVRFIILVLHELSLVALVGWYYPQNDERIEDFTIENRGISCNAWIGIPQSCFSKKPMSLWCFFFPVKKKNTYPTKNIWRRIAQAAWRLGSEVFSIKKNSSEGWARSLSGYPGSRSKECPGTSSKFGSEKITKKTNKTWYKVGL